VGAVPIAFWNTVQRWMEAVEVVSAVAVVTEDQLRVAGPFLAHFAPCVVGDVTEVRVDGAVYVGEMEVAKIKLLKSRE
jgi:hypothetical protein